MAGAVAALHGLLILVGIGHYGYALVLHPYGVAYLDACLVLFLYRLYGTRWAHLGTSVALRTAVAALVTHGGLHQGHQVG